MERTSQGVGPGAAGTTTTYEAPPRDPLEEIVAAGFSSRTKGGWLEGFLAEPSAARALALWLGPDFPLAARHGSLAVKERILRRLERDMARIDGLIAEQVNAVLHSPAFQKLEASWRGLRYLVEQRPERAGEGGAEGGVEIRVLNASRHDLGRDLGDALEFDQSYLFRKVYSEGLDMPGATPYGVLLGDYEFTNHPEDINLLAGLTQVAAASFAPLIAAAHPALLGLNDFGELEKPRDLARVLDGQLDYLKWRALRESEDARFLALALPRVLLRRPYGDDPFRRDGFHFRERVGPGRRGYLWGNAAYAYGAVLMRTFAQNGWLAEIRGVRARRRPGADQGAREAEPVRGGVVTGLPTHWFGTDRPGLAPRCATEVIVTDAQQKVLGDLGFLPLCWCQDTDVSAFYGSQSIQTPKEYHQQEATANARLSAMLQYMFCASRFAHHIKIIARDRVGSFATPAELEAELNRWLLEYTDASGGNDMDMKARYPLREGRAEMHEVPGKPGRYTCRIFLRPQFQLEQLAGTIRLETRPFNAGV